VTIIESFAAARACFFYGEPAEAKPAKSSRYAFVVHEKWFTPIDSIDVSGKSK